MQNLFKAKFSVMKAAKCQRLHEFWDYVHKAIIIILIIK